MLLFQIGGCLFLGFGLVGLRKSCDSFIHDEVLVSDFSHYEVSLNDHLSFYQQLRLLFFIVKLISFIHLLLINLKTVSIYFLDMICRLIMPKLVSYFSSVANPEKNPVFFGQKKYYMYFYWINLIWLIKEVLGILISLNFYQMKLLIQSIRQNCNFNQFVFY